MALLRPQPGLLIRYAYLWRDQFRAGLEEGLKDRPCVVILAVETEQGVTIVTVAPVTHRRPERSGDGIEIPLGTKRRLGLDDTPSWIIATEVNRFAWPGPDLRPVAPGGTNFAFGLIPAALFQALKTQIVRNGRLAVTRRD